MREYALSTFVIFFGIGLGVSAAFAVFATTGQRVLMADTFLPAIGTLTPAQTSLAGVVYAVNSHENSIVFDTADPYSGSLSARLKLQYVALATEKQSIVPELPSGTRSIITIQRDSGPLRAVAISLVGVSP